LISIFEKKQFEKFKVYVSKNISIKSLLDVSNVEMGKGTYIKNKAALKKLAQDLAS